MKNRYLFVATGLGCLVALVLMLAAAAHPGVAQAAPEHQAGSLITVTVKSGDNLGKYATIYGVSGASLVAANHFADPNLIFPGQVVTIPVVKSFTPSLTTPFYYVVQSGDTLNGLGQRFEMDPSWIGQVNALQNNVVVAGATLLVPAGPHLHVALAGETLKSIAALHGVTVAFLLTCNSVPNPDLIFSGQPIFVPTVKNAAPVALHGAAPIPVLPSQTPGGPTATATKTTVPGATATKTPTPVASATPTLPGAQNFIRVTVRSGESLLTYHYRYGLSGGVIRSANPQLKDPNLIFPGDQIVIPIVVSFTPSRTTPFFYVVLGGDSAASIAAKFEMTSDTLTAANPGANFAAGSTILVPAGPHLYTAKQGDTLASIAAKYGTTVEFLLTGNNLPNPNAIFVGQQIFVPTQYNKTPVAYN